MVKRRGRKDIHGLLLIDKPAELSSAGVVGKIRGFFRLAKVGHAGTLDPLARGLLPICINEGTKLATLLGESGKTYRTKMRLGIETDTQDTEGEVVAELPVLASEAEIRAALERFTGDFDQLPPMFSAKKKDGEPLYKLARQGEEIERKAVPVHVSTMNIHKIDPPDVVVSISVTKGFYVRTFCHDVGQALGCGAHMTELVRTEHGGFLLENAIALDDLFAEGRDALDKHLIPLDDPRIPLPLLRVDDDMAKLLDNGQQVPREVAEFAHDSLPADAPELWRAQARDGRMLALMRLCAPPASWSNLSPRAAVWRVERGFTL